MIAKILISNIDTVVLLLLTNFKPKLEVWIKGINTDFISNLSNLCEKILETFTLVWKDFGSEKSKVVHYN